MLVTVADRGLITNDNIAEVEGAGYARWLQLIAKIEGKLLALECRGRRGDLLASTDIAAGAATDQTRA